MFATRTCVRNVSIPRPIAGLIGLQQRRAVSRPAREALLQADNPVAEQLAATGLWYFGRNNPKKARQKKFKGDKHRVNITSEKLCDDIISYIRPSLERHAGCDIVDLYPGSGVWSRKMHDVLQPRSHILLEPDVDLYAPFLEPLTSRPNVTLIPKSGIVWAELNEVLTKEHLPHQVERNNRTSTPQRNDTLLVLANLAFFPKKKYKTFANVTSLLLYQFIHSISCATLFQKYGMVRMLIWTDDDDKSSLIPRTIQKRRRLSVDAEMSTDYIAEVAGGDPDPKTEHTATAARFMRDHAIDLNSVAETVARMEASGTRVPAGRESALLREYLAMDESRKSTLEAGAQPAYFNRPYRAELEELEALSAAGKLDPRKQKLRHQRLVDLRYKTSWEERRHKWVYDMLFNEGIRHDEWNEHIARMDKYLRLEFLLQRDNLHIWRQSPHVLSWDRRPMEPLVVSDREFYPNVPCALLDIQPKATHALLRQMGPGTNRAGDTFTVLMSTLLRSSTDPLSKVLESLYPGAAEGVLPNCPTLNVGDRMPPGYSEWNSRSLNEAQFVDLLQAWMDWPFRPSFPQLVARETDEPDLGGEADEPTSAAQGVDF